MNTETLLVELGTEELPPKSLKLLGLAFREGIVGGLKARGLAHGDNEWFASPRRLAVLVHDVALQAEDKTIELLGPPADRARDEEGNWTPAAAGFARKQGVAPEDLIEIDTPKGARIGLRQHEAGVTCRDSLNAVISETIDALPIAKRMRWGASRAEFVRPVHWIVAMLGRDTDHGEILGISTGNQTRGHRFHSAGPITIASPEQYRETLANAKVVASFEERQTIIRDQVEVEASGLGAEAVIDQDLLDEVTGLVEWPVALTGAFEERFLEVPSEALIMSMKEHQKYFHLVGADGALLPNFITISNIESTDPIEVISGNERVIRPRLSDAAFFYETDKKTPLPERLAELDKIVFQQKLGTVGDKSKRVAALASELANVVGADPQLAQRAGELCKADLVTDMVQEFSDMQGIAGAYYARHDGEDAAVAEALEQQYWPRFAGDRLPQNPVALCLGLADRLDTLVGIFGIGQAPTGSKDPFALRRASLAVLRIVVENDIELDLSEAIALAQGQYATGVIAKDTDIAVFNYMIDRFRAWFEDEGIAVETFKAVSALALSQPLDIQRRVHAVNAFTALPEAAALAAANKRVSNILSKVEGAAPSGEVSTNLLQQAEEKALHEQLVLAAADVETALQEDQYTQALTSLAALRGPVDAFFDGVMVNADDTSLRENRLSLLKSMRDLFMQVADISQLATAR
ncbi:MAG: glycine--tRNA ligase subunit beta [Halioglobus sp.]